MSPEALCFAQAHRRLLRCAEILHALPLPQKLKIWLAQQLGRRLSPWRRDLFDVLEGMRQGLGLDVAAVRQHSKAWYASHGLFALSFFDYPKMDADWLRSAVHVDHPEVLQRLVETGGVILTYHSFHHNTLFVALGEAGARLHVVAASEKNSAEAPYTGRFMRLINGGSAAHFHGGSYLFTDEKRALVQGVRAALRAGDCLVVLCDNWLRSSGFPALQVLGRRITVGTGALRLAKKAGAPPVYFVMFYSDLKGGYTLSLKEAGPLMDEQDTLQRYFEFLEQCVRIAPWAWQGWPWYAHLPKITEVK